MQDLRIRFGVILALALMPLLVFSAWSSYYDYSKDQKLRNAVIQDAGVLAVREIITTLDTTKSLLLTTAHTIEIEDCKPSLKLLTQSYYAVNNMAILGPDGRVLCSVFPVATNQPGFEAVENISPESPFYINSYHFDSNEGPGAKDVVLMSYGYYVDDVLTKMIFANTNVSNVNAINRRDIIPSDVEVSVVSRTGNTIVGQIDFDFKDKNIWAEAMSKNGLYQADFIIPDGIAQSLTVLPTEEPEIFVTIVAPKQSLWDWNRVNPLASSIVPFLSWAFGFVAIWIATDVLLLRHLRRMERSTHDISKGSYAERLGSYETAPKQIQELAGSFDDMLETLKSRDSKLTDSLDEKETLLREIHHRVKNNLQIIISLLNMQKRGSTNPEFLEAIEKTRNRVSTIALVHKALYESDDIRRVDMEFFITQLVNQLSRELKARENDIQVSSTISSVGRDPDQATPVGLFIVEAMTNAIQHKLLRNGSVTVKIFDDQENTIVQICDAGPISNPASDGPKASLKLMAGFARQLSGGYSSSTKPDERVAELVFPLPSH